MIILVSDTVQCSGSGSVESVFFVPLGSASVIICTNLDPLNNKQKNLDKP
jgi:hypothetical protein